ncbi:MAG TPA: hypothetical protein VMZ50_09560, partial [Phycisphaerae bacterium]|nr:hypothetical protein [Phycisphaerae bacterium]
MFRWLVGAILGVVAAWLIVGGAREIADRLGQELTAGMLLGPVFKIVGALAILAVYWYALWSESAIRRTLENIFAIPELLRKLTFTLALLCIYRIGFHIPLPGLDQERIASFMQGA